MICKIADLLVEVPEAGGMAPRCRAYISNETAGADIIIRAASYCSEDYPANTSPEQIAYMESGRQFCIQLMKFGGIYLHASAVELEGRAYLFSGDCGAGKSTHTRLWQQTFGGEVFNDDKPALRCLEGKWFAYGTPWCGKDGINQNKKVPLAGICFLKQAGENRIRRLPPQEAIPRILRQTLSRFAYTESLDTLLGHLDKLLRQIPVYELENRPEPDAARLSYETMRRGAEEAML